MNRWLNDRELENQDRQRREQVQFFGLDRNATATVFSVRPVKHSLWTRIRIWLIRKLGGDVA